MILRRFPRKQYHRSDPNGRSAQERCSPALAVAGSFVLSINDTPEIRVTFAAFEMEDVTLKYTIGAGEPVGARELIIMKKGVDVERPSQGELL